MRESDFYEWLETQPVEDKIVSIKYKYSHEKEWTQSNEILEVGLSYEDVYVWLDDWDEGQQDIEILGCIPVSDINVPIFASKTENSSEIPNNCEHITEDGVTCAKYPACDDCLDNPLNKVEGSERLVKGKDEPTISKMEQVDEPQTEYPCDTCVNNGDHDGECSNCVSDSEVIKWKTPSHYKPTSSEFIEDRSNWIWVEPTSTTAVEDEPKTQMKTQNSNLTFEKAAEPQYDIDKGTIKCDNCSENGSYKCSKCDGEMYFKRLEVEDEPQTDCPWK